MGSLRGEKKKQEGGIFHPEILPSRQLRLAVVLGGGFGGVAWGNATQL